MECTKISAITVTSQRKYAINDMKKSANFIPIADGNR